MCEALKWKLLHCFFICVSGLQVGMEKKGDLYQKSLRVKGVLSGV